jgi:hypothetical protein
VVEETPTKPRGRSGALSRRKFLEIAGAVSLAPLFPALGGCAAEASAPARAPLEDSSRWMFQARIAGLDFSEVDSEDEGERPEVDEALDDAVRAGATVIEGDSVLSDYADDDAFEASCRAIEEVARKCHERNLKIVWYIPSLEVITARGERAGVPSMAKDHPDWVQVNVDNERNVFYGGKEHWVEKGAESAWLCHNSGYREYFFERVKRLARTGIDGLWVDVPLFMDTVLKWMCTNPACVEKFRHDTGLDASQLKVDWDDPTWRTWIHWRHEDLNRFCLDVLAAARSQAPSFEIVFEVVTLDCDAATVQGLDGAWTTMSLSKPHPRGVPGPPQERLTRVWEIDSVSNDHGMRPALHDDWICKIRMNKFAKGCDRGGPTWVFSYGAEEADAGLVMAVAVAAGACPYETQTPQMVTTVGQEFRTRTFRWIGENRELLFDAARAAKVAILHSSSTRDYVERGEADTVFVSSMGPYPADTYNSTVPDLDPTFLTGSPIPTTKYLADYTGMCKLLSHGHVPFEIVPVQGLREADDAYLASFRLIVAPSLECLSDLHVEMLRRYVERGGHVLFTGRNVGWKDHLGAARAPAHRLDAQLGFDSGAGRRMLAMPRGAGQVHHYAEPIGRAYLRASQGSPLPEAMLTLVRRAGARLVEIEAQDDHRHVHVELTRWQRTWLVHLVNYAGAPDRLLADEDAELVRPPPDVYPYPFDYRIVRKELRLRLALPAPIRSVRMLSFDHGAKGERPPSIGPDGFLTVPVHQYTVLAVET